MSQTSVYGSYGVALLSLAVGLLNFKLFFICLVAFVFLNRGFFEFLRKNGGLKDALLIFPGIYCYTLCLALGVALGAVKYHLGYRKLT